MRLIDADALMTEIETIHFLDREDWCMVIDTIDYTPTIDAVPVKHGKWTFDAVHYDVDCSVCNESSPWTTPYCPHCGARMDEVE